MPKFFCTFPPTIANTSQFRKNEHSVTQGLPYDFNSSMQLRYNAYSSNQQPIMVPKVGGIPMEVMGASNWPSGQDYLDINLSYCGETTNLHTSPHSSCIPMVSAMC